MNTIHPNHPENLFLSICIPTFNQPKEFEALLQSLISQLTPEVELVVCDDSANSDTEVVAKKHGERFPISYFHGEKKGFDAAILFLTKRACGKYIWWLGDDRLIDGAVQQILEVLKKHSDLSFVWLNSRNDDPNESAFVMQEDKFFKDRNEVITTDIGLLAFISATIVRREDAQSGVESAKKYLGWSLMSFYLVLHVLSGDGKLYFVHTPYIISKPKPPGEKRWYDVFDVFAVNLYLIAHAFDREFDKRSLKKALAKNFHQVWKSIIVERAKGYTVGFGSSSPKLPKLLPLYWSYPEFWVALPFLLMPRWMIRGCYRIYKIFF